MDVEQNIWRSWILREWEFPETKQKGKQEDQRAKPSLATV